MIRVFATSSVRLVLTFLALVSLTLLLATVAQAQSPSDDQYGSPTASGTAAMNDADFPGGGSGAGTMTESDPGVVASSSGAGASMGVLPSTGGSQLFFVALATITLGTTALLVLRRFAR
jgi:hypothetical protein